MMFDSCSLKYDLKDRIFGDKYSVLLYIAVALCTVIGQLHADKCDYLSASMLSLRCRLLKYAVFVGIMATSLNKCFLNICLKRGLQNQQRKAKLLEF